MSIRTPPANPATFRGLQYRLEDDLAVSSPSANQKNDLLAQMNQAAVHGNVMSWLADHALWLDRSEEIAAVAIEKYRTEPLLRSKLNLESPDINCGPEWLRISSMPRIPVRPAKVLGMRSMPKVVRRAARRHLSDYQRSHTRWMAAETKRSAELREQLQESLGIDERFEGARNRLRMTFDRGEAGDAITIRAILTEAIRNLSGSLIICDLELSGADGLAIDVACSEPEAISTKRHVPRDAPFRLTVVESEAIKTDRLVLLGYVVALTIADLAGLLRTERRSITLRLRRSKAGAQDTPVLSTRFNTDHILAAADRITEAISARKRPDIADWAVEEARGDKLESQT